MTGTVSVKGVLKQRAIRRRCPSAQQGAERENS
jgi:hypothetical protein